MFNIRKKIFITSILTLLLCISTLIPVQINGVGLDTLDTVFAVDYPKYTVEIANTDQTYTFVSDHADYAAAYTAFNASSDINAVIRYWGQC